MIILVFGVYIILLMVLAHFVYDQSKKLNSIENQVGDLVKSLAQMQKDHPVLINADLLFSKQLMEINAQLVSMDNQLQNLENKRNNDGSYQHALRILEMGGNKDEIISNCHLSNAEADLLLNLQAYRVAIKG